MKSTIYTYGPWHLIGLFLFVKKHDTRVKDVSQPDYKLIRSYAVLVSSSWERRLTSRFSLRWVIHRRALMIQSACQHQYKTWARPLNVPKMIHLKAYNRKSLTGGQKPSLNRLRRQGLWLSWTHWKSLLWSCLRIHYTLTVVREQPNWSRR